MIRTIFFLSFLIASINFQLKLNTFYYFLTNSINISDMPHVFELIFLFLIENIFIYQYIYENIIWEYIWRTLVWLRKKKNLGLIARVDGVRLNPFLPWIFTQSHLEAKAKNILMGVSDINLHIVYHNSIILTSILFFS